MQIPYTYKVENYSPYDSSVFAVYTPTDPTYEALGAWAYVAPNATAEQIQAAVIAAAPYHLWAKQHSAVALALVGVEGSGTAAAPVAPTLTPEQVLAGLTRTIQAALDSFARTRGYDNMLSACTYATSTVPKFAAEGQYCVEARDTVWAAAYVILADVQAGLRAMPTEAEALAELPTLTWPV